MSNKYSPPLEVDVEKIGSKRVREQSTEREGGEANHIERVGNDSKSEVRKNGCILFAIYYVVC